jgi:hypothetical protein
MGRGEGFTNSGDDNRSTAMRVSSGRRVKPDSWVGSTRCRDVFGFPRSAQDSVVFGRWFSIFMIVAERSK